MNNNANLLKKIEIGNPLLNLGLNSLYDHYQKAKTDEEIASSYHHILNCVEGSDVAEGMTYAMIRFSTNDYEEPLLNFVLKTIKDEA